MITRRKETVINYIMQGKTPTESCRLAGYSEKYAHQQAYRLMKDEEFSRALNVERERCTQRNRVTRELISKRLNELAQSAPRHSDRINANVSLAKLHNYMTENTVNVNTAMFTEHMTKRLELVRNRHNSSGGKDLERIEVDVVEVGQTAHPPMPPVVVDITPSTKSSTKIENSKDIQQPVPSTPEGDSCPK